MADQLRSAYRLSLKTELAEGQTLMSFLSALASYNGLRSPARFCCAFGLDLAGLKAGKIEALAVLSTLVGLPVDRLLTAAHLGKPRANLVGHWVDAIDLSGEGRICPKCLANDHAAHPTLRFETAVHYRAAWSHALVSSCAMHDCLLVPLGDPAAGDPRDDFASAVRDAVSHSRLPPAVVSHPLPIEVYIQERLAGRTTQRPILDTMELNDALFLCRYLGAPHREAHRPIAPVSLEERLQQTDRGFLIATECKDSIRAKLEDVAQIVNPHGAAEIGLRRVFMDLFDRLRGKTGQDMLAVRQILVDIGTTQNLIPFEQREALGLPVQKRNRQTLESASRSFGISDRELRAALIQLKAIPQDEVTGAANTVLFDVEPVSSILSRLKSSLNLVEAARLLGLHPQQLVRICDAHLLEPFFTRPSTDLKPLRYFERSAIEGFLARLSANCELLGDAGERVDVWEAGLKTCRQPVDIITAIHDGRIARTFRLGQSANVRTLLVDLQDVRNCVFEDSDELVSAEDCSQILTINILALRTIMQRGILKAEMGINPVNRRQQLSARLEVLQAFDRQFVSLNGLCQQYASSGSGIAQALHVCGVRPAFPPDQSVVRIYVRAEVQRVQGKIEQIMCHRELGKPRGSRTGSGTKRLSRARRS